MKTNFTLILVFLFQVAMYGQWFSGELELSNLRDVFQNEYEDIEGQGRRTIVEGVDTFTIVTQSRYTLLTQNSQQKLSGPRAALRYNIPLSEKFTVSVGLGLSIHFFRTDTNYVILDYEQLSKDTIAGGGSSVSNPNYRPCETFSVYEDYDLVKGTKNEIYIAQLPIGVAYALFENNLNLEANLNFGMPITNDQLHQEFVIRTDEELTTEDIRVCQRRVDGENRSGNDYLSDFSLEASLGIQFKVFKNFWAKANFAQSVIPIDKVDIRPANNDFSLPDKFRPYYFRVGLSVDLVLPKNLNKRRKNYLLKRNHSDGL